jgi:ATP-dependent Clp protease ATP-binding subunit ClpC
MDEQFRASLIVASAEAEARTLKHRRLGTEHLLLGLLNDPDCTATQALVELDVTVDDVRALVARNDADGESIPRPEAVPFTPRAKKALEFTIREALSRGSNQIANEHLLLAIVRDADGTAARILAEHDADPDTVRRAVDEMLPPRRRPQ